MKDEFRYEIVSKIHSNRQFPILPAKGEGGTITHGEKTLCHANISSVGINDSTPEMLDAVTHASSRIVVASYGRTRTGRVRGGGNVS